MSGKNKIELDEQLFNEFRKKQEFDKNIEKHNKSNKKLFTSKNPEEIIYYSQYYLRLDYLRNVFLDYSNKITNQNELSEEEKKFLKIIWDESKKIEIAIEEAAKGIRFTGDIYYIDIIELLLNSEKDLDKKIAYLFTTKEQLKKIYNIYSTNKKAKDKIRKTIDKVELLLYETERDKERFKKDFINYEHLKEYVEKKQQEYKSKTGRTRDTLTAAKQFALKNCTVLGNPVNEKKLSNALKRI